MEEQEQAKAYKIFGRAIVGTGVRARIRAEIAIAQLNETLDPSQSTGLNGKARLGPVPVSLGDAIDAQETVEQRIKAERLEQLVLGNEKLREEAAGRNGVFCLSADVRQSEGRLAARLLTVIEAGLTDMARLHAAPRGPAHAANGLARSEGACIQSARRGGRNNANDAYCRHCRHRR